MVLTNLLELVFKLFNAPTDIEQLFTVKFKRSANFEVIKLTVEQVSNSVRVVMKPFFPRMRITVVGISGV